MIDNLLVNPGQRQLSCVKTDEEEKGCMYACFFLYNFVFCIPVPIK